MSNTQIKNSIIGLLLVAVLGLAYAKFGKGPQENILPAEEAAKLALAFINKNLLQGRAEASLVGETTEEKGVYKFQIEVDGQRFASYVTKDGEVFFPEGINLKEEAATSTEKKAEERATTLGDFSVSSDRVCKENDKPIVYFFGADYCPHCKWEHPIVEKVMAQFADSISFHNNMDSDKDMDIFKKYSTGGIPTLVLGCKYYRVGSGESAGEEEETKALTALVCELTDGKPTDVCEKVKDLVQQIQ